MTASAKDRKIEKLELRVGMLEAQLAACLAALRGVAAVADGVVERTEDGR